MRCNDIMGSRYRRAGPGRAGGGKAEVLADQGPNENKDCHSGVDKSWKEMLHRGANKPGCWGAGSEAILGYNAPDGIWQKEVMGEQERMTLRW